ncbi:MAG: class I adenylate cyclase [Nitrospinae bacterium]|nr:class I adenylate cyclase [Nitrospinota bacterium]
MIETLIKNKDIFLEYNKHRLKRAFSFMPKRTAMVLRALPFLLHVNHKAFPGFVDNPATPCGINQFRLTPNTQEALASLFPDARPLLDNPNALMPKRQFIRSLLLMGSIGSIAQTNKSDFDFWVCINEDAFKPAWMERFMEKLKLVEEWADKEYDVETHFFPTDIKKVQDNNFGESDKESAGSSQAKLLKEEFYRTMILLVGKVPVWWIIPPGTNDEEYNKLKALIPTDERLGKDGFIDLGNLHEISYEEFFGAALWQMNKAMDSPFKSVLKMGMLEGYIGGGNGSPVLLCTELKKKVFSAEGGPYDPYMMMFNHILNYYKNVGKEDVLDLICKCFYIKIGVKMDLNNLQKESMNFKEKAVLNYIQKWGWNQGKLMDLNSYKEWSFDKVLQLGNEVHNYMVKTYQSLADRLKEESSGEQIITEKDLTILGRKLFTFYSKKPNKVENLRKAFDEGLIQDDLTFHTSFDKSRRIVWNLYRGQLVRANIDKTDVSNKLLKKDSDLISLIIWMVYNKICDLKTHLYLTPNPTEVVLADIQAMVKDLFDFFPDFKISTLKNEDLLSSDKKKKVYIVINFFSQRTKWEVESVAVIYLSTWGELFYENFKDPNEGLQKVCDLIKEHYIKDVSKISQYFRIFVPKGLQSEAVLKKAHAVITKNAGPVPRLDK